MADWYVSSVAWTAIAQFAASTAYSIGQIVRPLTTPAFANQFAFRCTTAGTSGAEPAWPGNNTATVTTGGATFTNVSGQSTYGWSAAAGNLWCMGNSAPSNGRLNPGDRAFLSSDHTETTTSAGYPSAFTGGIPALQFISVNRAGSVPPVAADVLPGANIVITTGSLVLDANGCDSYWQGITFTLGGSAGSLWFNNSGNKSNYFKDCSIVFTTSTTTASITNNNPSRVTFDNTTVRFNNAGQRFAGGYPTEFHWINTPAALPGTVPTVFMVAGSQGYTMTLRGVDLSALTTTFYTNANLTAYGSKFLLDSCRIAPGLVRLGTVTGSPLDAMELVNCYDGTRFVSENHTPWGDLTTEFTITLSGGAQDNAGAFSHKMVTTANANKLGSMFNGFWLDVNNTLVSGTHTATVEIISSVMLLNDEISLLVEYEGTAGSSLATFASSLPNPLATPAAVTASTATWNASPATPVRQRLSVSFTPQTAGRLRAQVRLGKPSTTVWYNPQITVT